MGLNNSQELLPDGSIINSRYEVVKTLGFGGMGTVVKVRDLALDGEIGALKILFPHLASDQIQFARFRNEVLLARRLSHPHIVRIYDFGSWEKYYFLSMEFVEGGTLSDQIYGRGCPKLQFDDALRYLLQISDALSCAHKAGVVHRDMKPDNIMITTDNMVKVADFGLARAIDIDKRFTTTGETVGTPYYMSPEQLAGEKPDARVDIYSLGIMAYEMVIGRRPFASDNYLELAHMHMNMALPDMIAINQSTPKWYKEFVEICCQKRREDRFSSSDEVTSYLLEHVNEQVKKKVYRVPAVLSMGVLPSVKRSRFGKIFKQISFVLMVIWISFLVVFMLPLGARVKGKIRQNMGFLEAGYPFLSFYQEGSLEEYLKESNMSAVHELIVKSPNILNVHREEILDFLKLRAPAEVQNLMRDITDKGFVLDLLLTSSEYETVNACVDVLVGGSPFVIPTEVEDKFAHKLFNFNEPGLVLKYFGSKLSKLSWTNKDGESLLIYAYKEKAWNIFRVLLERGISPDALFKDGVSLVSRVKKENPEIYELLVRYGADTSGLSRANSGKASYSLK